MERNSVCGSILSVSVHNHLQQPRTDSVKQTIGSFVGNLDPGPKDQVKGLLVCCFRCPKTRSIGHSDSMILHVAVLFICTVGQSDKGCQSEVFVSNYVAHSPSLARPIVRYRFAHLSSWTTGRVRLHDEASQTYTLLILPRQKYRRITASGGQLVVFSCISHAVRQEGPC